MIDINLIPANLRKAGKNNANAWGINLPQEVILGVAGGLIFLMVSLHLIIGAVWLIDRGRLSVYTANWQKLSADRRVLDGINSEAKNLRNKYNLIVGLTTQKTVVWSPKFNVISNAVPRGLWLRRMNLDKDALTIEGSVVSKSQGEIASVGLFLNALKQNNEFMKDFSTLEVNSIQRAKNAVVEVADFTVIAKLK